MSEEKGPIGERPTYWAFISYSHSDDSDPGRQWAKWLHEAIEKYEVPSDLVGTKNKFGETIPEQIYPVFRDLAELSVASDLSNELRQALKDSRHLVTICSPRALKSRHVSSEVAYFKSLGRTEKINAVIIEGSPNASNSDDPDEWIQECFVAPLRFEVDSDGKLTTEPEEPLAADMRVHLPDRTKEQGWTDLDSYRNHLKKTRPELTGNAIERKVNDYRVTHEVGLLRIVAGILGVPLRELTERDKAYQLEKANHRARVVARVAIFMTLLALAAVAAGGIAIKKQFEARIAEGKALLNQANSHNSAKEFPQAQMVAAQALGFSQFSGKHQPPPVWKFWQDETYPNSLLPNEGRYSSLVRKLDRIASGLGSSSLAPLPVWCSRQPSLPSGASENPVWAVEFSPDYNWVAGGTEDGAVRIYSWSNPDKFKRLKSPGPAHQAIRDIEISPDGKWLAVAYEAPPKKPDFFVIWKVSSNTNRQPSFQLHRVVNYDRIAALAWSPDSNRIVTAGGATYVKGIAAIWQRDSSGNSPDAEQTYPGRWIYDAAWSPMGDTIALAGHKQLILIDPISAEIQNQALLEFSDDTACSTVAFGGSGEYLSTGTTARDVYIWKRVGSGFELAGKRSAHDYAVRDVCFGPDAKYLFSSSTLGKIRVWNTNDLPQMSLQATLLGDSSAPAEKFPSIRAMAPSPDGQFLLTGLIDGSMRMWSLGRRENQKLESEGNIESISAAPEAQLIATAREIPEKNIGILSVFDAYDEKSLWEKRFPIAKRKGFAMRMKTKLLPGGTRLLAFQRDPASSMSLTMFSLYEADSGKLLDVTSLPKGIRPRVTAFSKSGNRIVCATKDGQCYSASYDPNSDKLPSSDQFIKIEDSNLGLNQIDVWDLVVSNDGTKAAIVGRHKKEQKRISFVHLLDTVEGITKIRTNVGPNVAMCADFSPDGSTLAVGTFDRRLVYILDTQTGRLQGKPLRGHGRGVTAVSYSPDGSQLASGSSRHIRVWDVQSRDEIVALQAHDKMVQSIAWEPASADRPSLLISGAEEPSLKFWPLIKPKLDLKTYFVPSLPLLNNQWLQFDSDDGTLRWNTESSPHVGLKNLASSSTIGLLRDAPGNEEPNWGLYLGSVQSKNWDSAENIYNRLSRFQRQRNSLIVNQSARESLNKLQTQVSWQNPPTDFIKNRAIQIQRLLNKDNQLWQQAELILQEILQKKATVTPTTDPIKTSLLQ